MSEILQNIFDFTEELDFMTKYGLVICNFILIGFLLVMKKWKNQEDNNVFTGKNILFATAHPDDEAMFFVPSIQSLVKNYRIHLICFSNGNFDGLGIQREKELEKCCKYLKIENLKIINDKDLQDGMKNKWKEERIVQILDTYVKENNIQGIFTFDQGGVSGHPNHIDVYRGVKQYKQYMEKKNEQKNSDIKFYQLETVNLLRKYIGIIDFFFSAVNFNQNFVYINIDPRVAWNSMVLHKSQFVWYRKLFVIFSRYAYINVLKKMK